MSANPFRDATVAPQVSQKTPFDAGKNNTPAASERQISFLRSLLVDREWDGETLNREAGMPVAEYMVPGLGLEWVISKRAASAAISYLKTRPWKEAEKTTATRLEMGDPADGSYALEFDGKLRFFHVESPTEGKWKGYTFVSEKAGEDTFPVRSVQRRARILEAIAADPEALARYGQELGECGVCHRALTDEESRRIGIGPVCRNK